MRKNLSELINQAESKGYRSGTIIDYQERWSGTDTLGYGEFDLKDNKLIKYEVQKHKDNPNHRRFDTIWSEEKGWTKIVNKPHGDHL